MIVIRERDDVRRNYEAALRLVGSRTANLAFSRALNRTGRPTFTAVKRALRNQSDIPRGLVDAGVTFKPATSKALQTVITGRGPYLPLRLFGARQFAYGVRAKVWGKHQQYRSAFIVHKFAGGAYKRLTPRRFPIRQLYGPSVGKELVKDQSLSTFEASMPNVSARAMHELKRLLEV